MKKEHNKNQFQKYIGMYMLHASLPQVSDSMGAKPVFDAHSVDQCPMQYSAPVCYTLNK